MRGLAWSDEAWVRLYTRNAGGWDELSYEAQAVYLAALRRFDTAGVLVLRSPQDRPGRAAALRSRLGEQWPLEVVARGLEELLARGWWVWNGDHDFVLDPEYKDRAKAPASAAVRARKLRLSKATTRRAAQVIETLRREELPTASAVRYPALQRPSLLPELEPSGEPKASARDFALPEEIAWRVEQVWFGFCERRARFFEFLNQQRPATEPTLTEEIVGYITDSMRRHDFKWMTRETREAWVEKSWTRAAGIGIFRDPWCTGRVPLTPDGFGNDLNNGGKLYIEPWRPWKIQRGKPDPVPRFAEPYFQAKEVLRNERAQRERLRLQESSGGG